jgi:hypothetical protein
VGLDERVSPATPARHALRSDAFEYPAGWLGATVAYKFGGTATQQAGVRIPRYQPPSVPPGGTNGVNDRTNDTGYRGGRVLYQSTWVAGSPGMTNNWDAFFKCPDCGRFVNASDPSSHGCGSPHYYCPVCGAEQVAAGNCTFDGTALVAIPNNLACRQEHLQAEEFDAFDLQVSVNRQAASAYPSLAAADFGRAAPGTPTTQPDTTVGPLIAHRAFPSDVSALGAYLTRNEGNVTVPLRIGNVYDFAPTMLDQALFDYHRVEIDPLNHSYGRLGEAGPLTRDTFRPFDAVLTATAQWALRPGSLGEPAGPETIGFVTAGTYSPPVKVVPLGQPAGIYTGAQLQYIDADGNGALSFHSMATGNDETTRTTRFNPTTDIPLEPLVSVLPGSLRVTESRLPHSDQYAQDSDPVALISMPAGKLQVVWATNRTSTDPAVNAAAAVGQPAPAGLVPAAVPGSSSPRNLVYATATGATGGNDDPLYRIYFWPTTGGLLDAATMLTADPAGTTNSAPAAVMGPTGDRWLGWHRSVKHAGGVESTLRYDTSAGGAWTWSGSGPTEFIYDTGLPKQNLRGFPTVNGAWLFWHTGTQGREQLMYRWNFDGTPNSNEGAVPVVNQVSAGQTNDVTNTLEGYTIRRHAATPFTYAKDPSVFVETGVVNLFFSGFLRSEQQADICWTRYDLNTMAPADANQPANNRGKLAFAQVPDEELRPDGLRQQFASRHLDWLVDRDFQDTPIPAALPSPDPALRLGLVYDAAGDGMAPTVQWFNVLWQAADRGEYLRSQGTYRVTPILTAFTAGATPPAACTIPVTMTNGTRGWYLRDPGVPGGARQVALEVAPASGVLQFSSPLYDLAIEEFRRIYAPTAPVDPTAVFNSSMTSGGLPLANVVVNAWYTPYIWRVTRSGAQDDSPSAFYHMSSANRLTVFWRRSYPASEAPHFGRAAFMYKVLSNSVHVGRPPVSAAPTFTDLSAGGTVTPVTSDDTSGVYTFAPALQGHYLAADYAGPGRARYSERHQVVGWSTDTAVPVDTVVGEGPLAAVPELYNVPSGTGNAMLPAVRYWLFWSSPRGVWDLRLVEDNAGTRYRPSGAAAPDLPIHTSTDIYTAVVAPEFGTLRPEAVISSITADPT